MPEAPFLRRVALAAWFLLAACGPPVSEGGQPETLPPPGDPITGLSEGIWQWVDFPDSACDDGSPTGIGVSLGSGPDLLVLMNGGGVCWDYVTCYLLNTAAHGPFGQAQFESFLASQLAGSVLDRDLPSNPFGDASLVFVPYCTGDVHAGNNVVAYSGPADTRTYHHVGHANVVAFLRRIAATWPSPRRLVVSGASAGGFGALVNYDTFRHYWPAGEAFLVDDSGPPLGEGGVPQFLLDAWYQSWGLGQLLDPLCGAACHTALSPELEAVAAKYPGDRMALLSSLEDAVISGYFLMTGSQFEQHLLEMSAQVIDPSPNIRYFYVAGTSHTMLGHPAAFVQGVDLLTWLAQDVSGDPAWTWQKP